MVKNLKRRLNNLRLLIIFIITGRQPITEKEFIKRKLDEYKLKQKAIVKRSKKKYSKAPSITAIEDRRIEQFFKQ